MAGMAAGSVVAAVKRDLAGMPKAVGESGLAATALRMAEQLDDPEVSAASKSLCSKELREALAALRALAPPKSEDDDIERARKRRADRLAGKPASRSAASS